jgi:iron(III) transport system permease protein
LIERLASWIAALTALGVALPVLSLVWLALQPAEDLWPHLLAYVLPVATRDTLILLIGVGFVTLIAGAGPAFIVSRFDFAGRRTALWLAPLPLAIPTYIAAYVYVDLFEPLGLAHRALASWLGTQPAMQVLPQMRSMTGAIGVMGIVLSPYVYLSTRAALQVQGLDAIEAARTLGAPQLTILRRIVWPSLRPAVAVGLSLVALETLNDIGASEYLGIRTLTVSVFSTWLNRGSLGGAAQIALAMILLVALLVAAERKGRARAAEEISADHPRLIGRRALPGWRGAAAFALCALPVLIGFVIPFAYLAIESLRRGLFSAGDALLRAGMHSVVYAALAALVAILLALCVAMARRWRRSLVTRIASNLSPVGYGLPGLVLALGLLAPVLAIDNGLNALARWAGLPSPGLVLIGSGAAIVIAYVIRFLAVPSGFLADGLARIPADYDDSAAISGASRMTAFRKVHGPLLMPALGGAALVVFVDALKELPATLLLRPLNVETLATSIYQYASRGNFEEGAAAALLIVAASVIPVLWLARATDLPQGPA